MKAKETDLKGKKSEIPVPTLVGQSSLIAGVESLSGLERRHHNIPTSQSLVQSKVLTHFTSKRSKRRESYRKKVEGNTDCFMSFRERSHL